jgi:hypothetical protein
LGPDRAIGSHAGALESVSALKPVTGVVTGRNDAGIRPFIFGHFEPSLFSNVIASTANKPGRLDLSDALMKTLGVFARNGDPNNATLGVTWPAWPKKLILDASLTAKSISVQ